jgi:hypothetical protein
MLVWRMKHAVLRENVALALLAFLLLLLYPFLLLLYVVGGFILCVCLGLYLGRKTSSALLGIVIFCAGFALLYGHEIYEHYKWENLCKTAGSFVYKTVKSDNFFYDDQPHNETHYERALKKGLTHDGEIGFEYVEGRLYSSKLGDHQIYRFSLDEAENLVYVPVDHPNSRYAFRSEIIKASPYISENVLKIVDIERNQPISLRRRFSTRGGPVLTSLKSFFSGLGSTGSLCVGSEKSAIFSSISPVNKRVGNAEADADHAETKQLTCHNPDSAEGSCGFVEDDASNQ